MLDQKSHKIPDCRPWPPPRFNPHLLWDSDHDLCNSLPSESRAPSPFRMAHFIQMEGMNQAASALMPAPELLPAASFSHGGTAPKLSKYGHPRRTSRQPVSFPNSLDIDYLIDLSQKAQQNNLFPSLELEDYPYMLPGINPSIYIPKNADGTNMQPDKLPSKMAMNVIKAMSDKGIRNKQNIISKICNQPEKFDY